MGLKGLKKSLRVVNGLNSLNLGSHFTSHNSNFHITKWLDFSPGSTGWGSRKSKELRVQRVKGL